MLVSAGPACALPAQPYWKFRGRELQSVNDLSASLDHESGRLERSACSGHKLVLALQETLESVSLCLTAAAPVALNWRL